MAESISVSKPVAVRIDDHNHSLLGLLAQTSGKTLPQLMREVIDIYLMNRLASPMLDAEIKAAKDRFANTLNALRSKMPINGDPPSGSQRAKGPQITLRISQPSFVRLNGFAAVDDNTMADQIRTAVARYLEDEGTLQHIAFARSFVGAFEEPHQATADREHLQTTPHGSDLDPDGLFPAPEPSSHDLERLAQRRSLV